MNPRVQKVNVLNNSILELEFDNGQKGQFNITPYLKYPVYQPLRDFELFKRAKATMGFVSWNDEIDMSPDNLYLDAVMV